MEIYTCETINTIQTCSLSQTSESYLYLILFVIVATFSIRLLTS
jgi:hypothetical protein